MPSVSNTQNVLFGVLLAVASLAFALSVVRLVRFIRLGRPDNRLKGQAPRRLLTMLQYAFGQKRVLAERFGLNHFFLFWGFLILLLANGEFVINAVFPRISFELLGPNLYPLLTLAFDLVSLTVLLNVGISLFRRLVVRPAFIDYKSAEGFIILGAIAGLMIAFFGMHGAEIASGQTAPSLLMPISQHIAAPLLTSVLGSSVPVAGRVFWWLHALILLAFLNYLPYSKHLHILMAIPSCYCRAFKFVSMVSPEEYALGKSYGVRSVDQFTWKDLLDFTACTECGRCNANCPATNTNKPLNPRYLIHDGKMNLFANGSRILHPNNSNGLLPLIGESEDIEGTIGEKSIWNCTTCGACMQSCPVFIEHVPKIIKMRRHLVENIAKFPPELNILFEAIEQRSNPWGMVPADRTKWVKDLDVAQFSESHSLEYLFYVGCAGAFDSRNKRVAVAVVNVLKAAGVSFGILGLEERCCGDSLRRLGNEFVFDRSARENVELFKKYNVRKILCYCPHCYSTLKNDYRQYGLEAEVFHHSELLDDLARQGRLSLGRIVNEKRIVFHDSCYLGRYNGLYQPPRDLLERVTGSRPVELDRNREKSFCCGAGGGRMWMEEDPENRININRVREALAKESEIIAVNCPYCMTMFEDGLKDLKARDRVQVLDIAEIVASRVRV
jgi:Fe-S oxidoreductase